MDTESGLATDVLAAKTEELRAKLVAFVLHEIRSGAAGPLPDQIAAPLLKSVLTGVRISVTEEVSKLRDSYEAAIDEARTRAIAAEKSYSDFTAEFEKLREEVRRSGRARGQRPAEAAGEADAGQLVEIERRLIELRRLLAAIAQSGAVAPGASALAEPEDREEERGLFGVSPRVVRHARGVAIIAWALVMLVGALAAIVLVLQRPAAAPAASPSLALLSADALKQAAANAVAAGDALEHLQPQKTPAGEAAMTDALGKAKQAGESLESALLAAAASAHGGGSADDGALADRLGAEHTAATNADALINGAITDPKGDHAGFADAGRSLSQTASQAEADADQLQHAASAQLAGPRS